MQYFLRRVLCPSKFVFIRKKFGSAPISILDVGCGNKSFEITNRWLNVKEYHGLDKEVWHGDEESYQKIPKLFKIDLDDLAQISEVPENTYDCIVMNHVIEHLMNGEKIVAELVKKLKKDGIIYLEFPSPSTINKPSAIGFYNFYDEPTHLRIYDPKILSIDLMKKGLKVIRFGTRRNLPRLFFISPLMILYNIFISLPFKGRLDVRGLWDLLGVASFVIIKK